MIVGVIGKVITFCNNLVSVGSRLESYGGGRPLVDGRVPSPPVTNGRQSERKDSKGQLGHIPLSATSSGQDGVFSMEIKEADHEGMDRMEVIRL